MANPGRLADQESFFESAPGEEPAGEEFELITTLDPESFFESRLKKAFQIEKYRFLKKMSCFCSCSPKS